MEPNFQLVCAVVGKFFIESQLAIERLGAQVKSLREQEQAGREELTRLKAQGHGTA